MSLKYSAGHTSTSTTWTLKCTDLPQFDALQSAADQFRSDDKLHLRNLCNDTARCAGLTAMNLSARGKIILDYSRQRVTGETMELLYDLADAVGLTDRIRAMRSGAAINATEDRPVLHHVLRMPDEYETDDPSMLTSPTALLAKPPRIQRTSSAKSTVASAPQQQLAAEAIMKEIHALRDKVFAFADAVRAGRLRSATDQAFTNILVLGTSGVCTGIECVAAALECLHPSHVNLRFLSNLDPIDFYSSTAGWDPAETLVVVVSKTFTDTDVMLNARSVKSWLVDGLKLEEDVVVKRHMVAVSCNPTRCAHFGIDKQLTFRLFEWVSDRFSVCSGVGLLPISLRFGRQVAMDLLDGAHAMDEHFFHSPLRDNIPVILGLIGVWNSTFLGYTTRALLPYSHSLRLFPSHVQHVDMESNGKRVALDGTPLLHRSAEINFGQAGSDCQSSFFQLLHQGRPVPVDFIGFMESQSDLDLPGEAVSNHDELMSNFFAQPDALAYGKTLVDLSQEGAPEPLREHMVFPGNRPSSSILLTRLDAYSMGQLMALYEHRTAVQGFVWGINSFDQFGLDLGKTLVKTVRAQLSASRKTGASVQGFNYSTSNLLEHYLSHGRHKELQQAGYGRTYME